METSDIIQLVIVIILLSASAFFSSAETALMTSNKLKMRNLADNGNKRAAKVLKVTENTDKMLSAILIGNNIVNLTASSINNTYIEDIRKQACGYCNRYIDISHTCIR